MNETVGSYVPKFNIKASSDLDLLENIIVLYSATRVQRGMENRALRKQLVTLLALYIQYGYNSETKLMAAKLFKVKIDNMHNMNLELVRKGYLKNGEDRKIEKTFNPELENLSRYYKFCTKNNLPVEIHLKLLYNND